MGRVSLNTAPNSAEFEGWVWGGDGYILCGRTNGDSRQGGHVFLAIKTDSSGDVECCGIVGDVSFSPGTPSISLGSPAISTSTPSLAVKDVTPEITLICPTPSP